MEMIEATHSFKSNLFKYDFVRRCQIVNKTNRRIELESCVRIYCMHSTDCTDTICLGVGSSFSP